MFVAVVAVLSVLATFRLELAVVLQRSARRAAVVATAAVAAALAIGAALLFVAVAFSVLKVTIGPFAQLQWLSLLVPVSVIGNALFAVATALATQRREFGRAGRLAAARGLAMVLLQCSLGALHAGAAGLVLGYALSSTIGAFGILWQRSGEQRLAVGYGVRTLRKTLVEHRAYLVYTAPGSVLNMAAVNIATLLVAVRFDAAIVGQFGTVQRALAAPLSLVGQAVSQVLLADASSVRSAPRAFLAQFLAVERRLVLASVLLFAALAAGAEPLSNLALGATWSEVPSMVIVMAPLFAFRFVGSAMSQVAIAAESQRMFAAWQLVLLMIAVCCWLPRWGGAGFSLALGVWSAGTAMHYAILLFLIGRRLRILAGQTQGG